MKPKITADKQLDVSLRYSGKEEEGGTKLYAYLSVHAVPLTMRTI
jgi:hypothetical protein